jgi:hypothetical protein
MASQVTARVNSGVVPSTQFGDIQVRQDEGFSKKQSLIIDT